MLPGAVAVGKGVCEPEEHGVDLVLARMAAGILLVGKEGMALLTNPAFCEMFGLDAPCRGFRAAELVRHPDFHEILNRALASGEPDMGRFSTGIPQVRVLEATVVPLDRECGGGALALFYDVTATDGIERMHRDFLANASHQLRTPVSSILASVESLTLGREIPCEQRDRFLGMIERNAQRLARLTRDLLELTRLEQGDLPVVSEWLDLGEILDLAESSLESLFCRREIRVDREIQTGGVRFHADSKAMEELLINLLENAAKFGKRGGTVTVRGLRNGEGAFRLEVEDRGEGIAEAHLTRIFERFYRIEGRGPGGAPGTGLGLAIVQSTVRRHGGRVWAESKPGEKTLFVVELPLPEEPLGAESTSGRENRREEIGRVEDSE